MSLADFSSGGSCCLINSLEGIIDNIKKLPLKLSLKLSTKVVSNMFFLSFLSVAI